MNRYARTIAKGTKERGGRISNLVVFSALVLVNLVVGVGSILNGRLLGLLNIAVILVLVVATIFLFRIWAQTDKVRAETQDILAAMEARRRERFHAETSAFLMPEEIKLVDDPKDADDVFQHMMSRAFKGEAGVGMYQDVDGVWRDSDTHEALPVQNDGSGPENGAQR